MPAATAEAAGAGRGESAPASRRPLVAGNWKMHGSTQALEAFASAWRQPPAGVDVLLCPPFGYLRQASALRLRGIALGAQNVATAGSGAFTGEHSAAMAKDLGARFAIVGHSERRRLFGETDAVVAEKFGSAQAAGLVPILCVGETLTARRAGAAETTVLRQLDAVLAAVGAATFAGAILAYEPVWAIGTGETATPAQAQSMHRAIRAHLAAAGAQGEGSAERQRILYGGSVTASNAAALFAERDVDGGLVGGASLDASEFAAICCAAAPPAAAP